MKTLKNFTVLLESTKLKVFIVKFRGGVAGRDNLLGVAQCTNTMGETTSYFERHIVTFTSGTSSF